MCDYLLYAVFMLVLFMGSIHTWGGHFNSQWSPMTNKNITKFNGNDKERICPMLNQQIKT